MRPCSELHRARSSTSRGAAAARGTASPSHASRRAGTCAYRPRGDGQSWWLSSTTASTQQARLRVRTESSSPPHQPSCSLSWSARSRPSRSSARATTFLRALGCTGVEGYLVPAARGTLVRGAMSGKPTCGFKVSVGAATERVREARPTQSLGFAQASCTQRAQLQQFANPASATSQPRAAHPFRPRPVGCS